MSFTTEQILEDLASFAEMSRAHFRHAHGISEVSGLHNGTVAHKRPEGFAAEIAAVVNERPAWTAQEMCLRLSVPYDRGTRLSVGLVLQELGLKKVRVGHDSAVVFGSAPTPKKTRKSNARLTAVLQVASARDEWTTAELLRVLGWESNKSTQVILGNALRFGGWVVTLNPVAGKQFRIYKKALAPVQASS